MKARLLAGELEDREVEITFPGRSMAPVSILGAGNFEQMEMDLQSMFEKIMPKQSQTRRLTVGQARPILLQQEIDALIDPEKINQAAVNLTEESGIVFIDEIDKITSDEGSSRGPDVSRQGVQRDLLPIVEGTTVNTKHGPVKTDHILFIAAGAFHRSKPSDLMPELQGRFPIRVEMHDLTRDDFARILREPRASLLRQYQALLGTEGITLEFADAGDRNHGRPRLPREPLDPEHRRPPAAHDPGARARGPQLRRLGPNRQARGHRRGPGPRATRGPFAGRRLEPVHPMRRRPMPESGRGKASKTEKKAKGQTDSPPVMHRDGVAYLEGCDIPIWRLEMARRAGSGVKALMATSAGITPAGLNEAFAYARRHRAEFDPLIQRHSGADVPAENEGNEHEAEFEAELEALLQTDAEVFRRLAK